jgi:PAS domain-containing protein
VETPPKLADEILDQVADALICANQTGTIIRWNRACTALFGYSAEEALGQSLELIIPEHLRAAHWRGFGAAMTKGTLKLQGRPTLRFLRSSSPRPSCVGIGPAFAATGVGSRARWEGGRGSTPSCAR